MNNSTTAVRNFICNIFGENTPFDCKKNFTATVEIGTKIYSNVQCTIKLLEIYGKQQYACYCIDIDPDNDLPTLHNTLIHTSYWSNDKFCVMSYQKPSLLIQSDELDFYITPD